MTFDQFQAGVKSPIVTLAGSVTGAGELALEGANRRPGEPDQVLVVGANTPVERRVGRMCREGRVRSRSGRDVLERCRERRLLGDLEAIAPRALDRRPAEDRLAAEQRAVRGRGLRGRDRLLLEVRRSGRERDRPRRRLPLKSGGREDRPVEERRLVRVRRRPGRAARRIRGDLREGVVDEVAEVRVLGDDHEVALAAGERLPGDQRRQSRERASRGQDVIVGAEVADGCTRACRRRRPDSPSTGRRNRCRRRGT